MKALIPLTFKFLLFHVLICSLVFFLLSSLLNNAAGFIFLFCFGHSRNDEVRE